MKPDDDALAKVGEAQTDLRRATQLWNAADLSHLDRCREALESAVAKLTQAEELLRHDRIAGSVSIHSQALGMKAEVLRLERVVDAASAFLRGAFPAVGGSSPVYSSGGAIAAERVPVASPGVEA